MGKLLNPFTGYPASLNWDYDVPADLAYCCGTGFSQWDGTGDGIPDYYWCLTDGVDGSYNLCDCHCGNYCGANPGECDEPTYG